MTDEPLNAELDADEEREIVTIRRAPKFSVFVLVGALIGFLITLVLTSLFPADPEVGFTASLGYFSLYGISFGAMIGAVIALLVDRRSSRRAKQVIAGKLAVHVEGDPSPVTDSTLDNTPNSDG